MSYTMLIFIYFTWETSLTVHHIRQFCELWYLYFSCIYNNLGSDIWYWGLVGVVLLLLTHFLDPCVWSDHPTFGPPASLSLHLASSFICPQTGGGGGWQCGAYVGAVEEIVCVVCVVVAEWGIVVRQHGVNTYAVELPPFAWLQWFLLGFDDQ